MILSFIKPSKPKPFNKSAEACTWAESHVNFIKMMKLMSITIIFLISNCSHSLTTVQTAETTKPGKLDLSGGMYPMFLNKNDNYGIGNYNYEAMFTTSYECQMRRGLIDNLDVGLKLYLVGIEPDIKYCYINSDYFKSSIDVAINYMQYPHGEYFKAESFIGFKLSSINSIFATSFLSITVTPKIEYVIGDNLRLPIYGSSVGIKLGKSYYLFPEAGYYYMKGVKNPFGQVGISFGYSE